MNMELPAGPTAVKTDAALNTWTRRMEDAGEPTPHLSYTPLGREEASFEPTPTWGCTTAERIGPHQVKLLNDTLGVPRFGGGGWASREPRAKRP